jgi:hypothetical protein
MGEELERLARIEATLIELSERMKRLAASDRRQWAKIHAQKKYSLIFAGVIGIGALIGFGGLNTEDKESLERIAVAVIVAGGAGVVGVNSNQFEPPRDSEDADRQDIH